jgi:hypothetical protein
LDALVAGWGEVKSESPNLYLELEKLLDLENHLILLRSQALVQLQTRGHNITAYLNRNRLRINQEDRKKMRLEWAKLNLHPPQD